MHHGIVLFLDVEAEAEAIRLSRERLSMAQDPGFILDTHKRRPHLTLLHLELDGASAVERVCDEMAQEVLPVLADHALEGVFESVRLFEGGWLWWLTPRMELLDALHGRVLERCAPLRSGPLGGNPSCMTPVQMDAYARHGCWFVDQAWNPHVTLQVLDGRKSGSKRRFPRQKTASPWRATSLVLAEMGQFGSVEKAVFQLPL